LKYFGILLGFLAFVFGIFWFNLTPTISPDDVEVTGELFKAEELSNPVFDKYNYALAITLDNKTDSNLHKGYYGKYFSNLYVYVDDFVIREYAKSSKELEEKGFNTRTAHGYTELPVKEKLMELGIYLQKNVTAPNLHGLYYFGSTFPAKIQYYVTNVKYNPEGTYIKINQKPNLDNSYLIYSHYEKRLGKNLSWVKLSKIDER